MPRLAPLSALVLAACGATTTTTTTTTTTATATEPAALTPPPRPWAELTHDERREHMVAHVAPAMEDRFRGFDAARFDDFSCATCHGADAREREFAMPNPSLLVLYPTGTIGQERVLAEHTDDCGFMFREVVPAMRTLLAAPEYDAATGTGFSCFACHPRAGDDDPLNVPIDGS